MAKTKEKRSVKRTYTLNADITDRFESLIPSGQRSQVVEHLLQRELEEIHRRQLRDAITLGLADMAEVNAEVSSDWNVTETEGWPST